MFRSTQTQHTIFNDGTSQADRYQNALDPAYIDIEGRSLEELIHEAQRLARELRFFDENDQVVSNWEALFIDDWEAYSSKSETGKAIQRQRWAKQMATYVEDPNRFQNDPDRLARLSRPHLTLFLTFLKLVGHIKSQLNGLSKDHLDFYFLERLGFTPKDAVPDVVNVLIELASDVDQLEVKKGTVLFAGNDEEGNSLEYTTDKDTVISRAQLSQLKTVFVDKENISIASARTNHLEEPDRGFQKMMELALGSPSPGDPLPSFPAGVNDLEELHAELLADEAAAKSYLATQLGFLPKGDFQDFKTVMATHLKDIDFNEVVTSEEWEEVYRLLDQAHKNRIKLQRQADLKSLHEASALDGFKNLIRQVYGRPEPGDDLPLFRGSIANLLDIHALIIADTNTGTIAEQAQAKADQRDALEYITEELFLTSKDFNKLITASQNPTATGQEWEEVYTLLELAERKVRSTSLPSPSRKELYNVFAEADIRSTAFSLHGKEEESLRFKTFGGRKPGNKGRLTPANLGFAITSPLLMLQEGKRRIEAFISFSGKDIDRQEMISLFLGSDGHFRPFNVYLSGEEEWIEAKEPQFRWGTFAVGSAKVFPNLTKTGNEVTRVSGIPFSQEDVGGHIRWSDSSVLEITEIIDENHCRVREVVEGNSSGLTSFITQYIKGDLFPNALRLRVDIPEEEIAIAPIQSSISEEQHLYPEFPAMLITLNHDLVEQQGEKNLRSHYQKLMDLKLDRLHLKVDVDGMRGMTLQNDQRILDGKKPFEPFGLRPEVGNSFYLAHPELCRKAIDSIEFEVEWMNMPDDFKEHYKNYWLVESDNPNLNDSAAAFKVKSRHAFKSKVMLYDSRAEFEVSTIDLFSNRISFFNSVAFTGLSGSSSTTGSPGTNVLSSIGGASSTNVLSSVGGSSSSTILSSTVTPSNALRIQVGNIPKSIKDTAPDFNYQHNPTYQTGDDVLESDRFLKLELDPMDFHHAAYDELFRKKALSSKSAISGLNINPPYTPKIKKLRVGYTAHTQIEIGAERRGQQDSVYHLHPFGYTKVRQAEAAYLLPQYKQEGNLYMGLENLSVPQNLSLLFQMSEGSANPNVEKPFVQWSYLRGDTWVDLNPGAILMDTTNGLLNTGIVQISIPADATHQDNMFPGQMHWLRVSCENDASGIPDSIEIATQAVSATFSSLQVAPGHFERLLPPASITETLDFTPGIRNITQPYTSIKGKPAEKDASFYNRISERLRHKNRALNLWDYERLTLEEFPEIYKVKCLPATAEQNRKEPGMVNVLVIPDLKGKLPFNPFEPKVSAATLFRVKEFLNAHAPTYAQVKVQNPSYVQLLTRCVVKFKEGYNEGFYKPKLVEEIKQFLSPWAYHQGGEITIGGSIYASVIVNFIAERPYIEYVANMKLFQSEDGEKFTDVRALHQGENKAVALRPDIVLVSAPTHIITVVDENGYDEDSFDGINYMRIELDFKVGENILS